MHLYGQTSDAVRCPGHLAGCCCGRLADVLQHRVGANLGALLDPGVCLAVGHEDSLVLLGHIGDPELEEMGFDCQGRELLWAEPDAFPRMERQTSASGRLECVLHRLPA